MAGADAGAAFALRRRLVGRGGGGGVGRRVGALLPPRPPPCSRRFSAAAAAVPPLPTRKLPPLPRLVFPVCRGCFGLLLWCVFWLPLVYGCVSAADSAAERPRSSLPRLGWGRRVVVAGAAAGAAFAVLRWGVGRGGGGGVGRRVGALLPPRPPPCSRRFSAAAAAAPHLPTRKRPPLPRLVFPVCRGCCGLFSRCVCRLPLVCGCVFAADSAAKRPRSSLPRSAAARLRVRIRGGLRRGTPPFLAPAVGCRSSAGAYPRRCPPRNAPVPRSRGWADARLRVRTRGGLRRVTPPFLAPAVGCRSGAGAYSRRTPPRNAPAPRSRGRLPLVCGCVSAADSAA